MTVTVDIDNQSQSSHCPNEQSCQAWISEALKALGRNEHYELSLRFVDEDESAQLNQRYRNKEGATNVLSFPSEAGAAVAEQIGFYPLGDIAICPAILEAEAREQDKELQDHWAHILIHGVLHLCGYDHQESEQAEAMENLEIEILKTLGIKNPYLIG